MSVWWETIKTYIKDHPKSRRAILVGGGAVAILTVALVVIGITNLINFRASQAAIQDEADKYWQLLEKAGAKKAAHSKMIVVDHPDGKKYLYVLGGVQLQDNISENRKETVVLNSVRRIEVNTINSRIIGDSWEGVGSEAWASMKTGHMEFGVIQNGNYLYVVGGDVNIPPETTYNPEVQVPLLFATIERLNLAQPTLGWELYGLLSGVNYYPEVAVVKAETSGEDQLHVVGGVYGNPFPPLLDEVKDTYQDDMLGNPPVPWTTPDLGGLKVIGNPSLFVTKGRSGGAISSQPTKLILTPQTEVSQAIVNERLVALSQVATLETTQETTATETIVPATPVVSETTTSETTTQGVAVQAVEKIKFTFPPKNCYDGWENCSVLLTDAQVELRWDDLDGFNVANPASRKVGIYWRKDKGYSWSRINTVPFSDGKFVWEIPSSYNGPESWDKSRIDFALLLTKPGEQGLPNGGINMYEEWTGTKTIAQYKTRFFDLIFPDGFNSETYQMGSAVNIQWRFPRNDLDNGFVLQWQKTPVDDWQTIASVPKGSSPDYAYNWTVPAQPTQDYTARIRVCPTTPPLWSAWSNCAATTNAFKIGAGGFRITSPTINSKWSVGSTQTISWDKGLLDGTFNVFIGRWKNGQYIKEPVNQTPINGTSVSWTVTEPPTAQADTWVESITYGVHADLVSFVILPEADPPSITVTSPKLNDSFELGDTIPIRWTSRNVPAERVKIYLCKPATTGETCRDLLVSPPDTLNDGAFDWVTGSDQTLLGTTWKIKIYAAWGEYSNATGYSATFTIWKDAPNPAFLDLKPNGGEIALIDRDYYVNWKMQDFDENQKVELLYSTNGGTSWITVADNVDSQIGGNYYTWKVPNTPTTTARFKICLANIPDSECVSKSGAPLPNKGIQSANNFTIKIYTPPPEVDSVNILKPVGGEDLTPGTNYKIIWSGNFPNHRTDPNPAKYDVDYYNEKTQKWYVIATVNGLNPRNGGGQFDYVEYNWAVPAISLNKAKIRVTARKFTPSDTPVSDMTGEFSIAGGSDELASTLSKALLEGRFVTTVGEDYAIILSGSKAVLRGYGRIPELGSDYVGTVTEFWKVGAVTRIGHLRFLIAQVGKTTETGNFLGHPVTYDHPIMDAVPVPQGRYGHKLVTDFPNYKLMVFGGASWAKELTVNNLTGYASTEIYKTFWVIDDAFHPLYTDPPPKYGGGAYSGGHDFKFTYGKPDYKFVGSISYGYTGNGVWVGTNGKTPQGNATLPTLADSFALRQGDAKKGLAFFGLAKFDGSNSWATVGGLRNQLAAGGAGYETIMGGWDLALKGRPAYFRIPVIATASANKFLGNGQWASDVDYNIRLSDYQPAYNLQAVGVSSDKAVAYGGQVEFQLSDWLTHDAHVPDYRFPATGQTFLYQIPADAYTERWFAMASMVSPLSSSAGLSSVAISPTLYIMDQGTTRQFSIFAYNSFGVRVNADQLSCTWSTTKDERIGTIDPDTGEFTTKPDAPLFGAQPVTVRCSLIGGSGLIKTATAEVKIRPNPDTGEGVKVGFVGIDPALVVQQIGTDKLIKLILRTKENQPFTDFANLDEPIEVRLISGIGTVTKLTTVPEDQTYKLTLHNDIKNVGNYNEAINVLVKYGGTASTAYADLNITGTIPVETVPGSFAADAVVVSSNTLDPVRAIYNLGGLMEGELTDTLQVLGLFGKGGLYANVEVEGSPISPDNFSAADVYVRLTNGVGDPIYEDASGNRYIVTIKTARATGTIVTNDRTFRPGADDRAERTGDLVAGRDDQYVYFDVNGTAHFRVYSRKITDPAIEGAIGTAVLPQVLLEGATASGIIQNQDTLVVTNVPGVPVAGKSTILAEPSVVPATGTDVSNVTVSLRDFNDAPATGYYVRLLSDRNGPGEPTDIISADQLVDTNGIARFTVKSEEGGRATLRISYAKVATELDDAYDMPNSATVLFTGMMELVPYYAKQGQGPLQITATGRKTNWEPGKTTVRFEAPAAIEFDTTASGRILRADGLSISQFAIQAADHPNTKVSLELTSGSGAFWPIAQGGDPRKIEVTTDATTGRANFAYEHGDTPGPVKIKATVTGGPTRELWMYLVDYRRHQYELLITTNPTLLAPGATSTVRAALYEYVNGTKMLVTEDRTLNFVVDDAAQGGTITNVQTEGGITQATYTKGSGEGSSHIFVTTDYDSFKIANVVEVFASANTAGITFNNPADVTINQSAQTITLANVSIAADAKLGSWKFVATTTFDDDTVESITAPFLIVPANADLTPRLASITPVQGLRGSIGLPITIVGEHTAFTSSSQIAFTHATNPAGSGITIQPNSLIRISSTRLQALVDIGSQATTGWWNVAVTTPLPGGNEVAELPGSQDFWVVDTANNLILTITPSRSSLPRDGAASAKLTIFVAAYDPISDTYTPAPDGTEVLVSKGTDGGTLNPATGLKTSKGYTTTTYTTDKGDTAEEATITATATIGNNQVSNFVVIPKYVAEGDFILLTANPTSLSLQGDANRISDLTAQVKDLNGQPVSNGTAVDFIVSNNAGSVSPTPAATASGTASSKFYRAPNLTAPTSVAIRAKATIPNVGTVYSNEVIINIGDNLSAYQLSFTSDKTTVNAGGADKAHLTATLTRNGIPQSGWQIVFSLSMAGLGDYITPVSGFTNAQGKLEADFIPGVLPGNVIITATPSAIPAKQLAITKTINNTISAQLSSISANPSIVPADNVAVSTIMVTLYNSQRSPLAGKTVTLTTDRTASDTIAPTSRTTDGNGRAIFTVRSSEVGISNIRAVVDGITLGPARISFEAASSLISATIDAKVPLQAKAYDRQVYIYLREKTTGMQPTISEVYLTDATNDKVFGLPVIYLHPGQPYSLWVKSRYHLARTRDFSAPTVSGTTITLDFTDTPASGQPVGLYISDLLGSGSEVFPGFNDNKVNAFDTFFFTRDWFRNSYLADFNTDSVVNSLDIAYWAANWFNSPGPNLP